MELFIHRHHSIRLAISIYGYLTQISLCYRFEPNTFVLKNYSACAVDKHIGMFVNIDFKEFSRNKFMANGEIISKETILPPTQVF